MGSNDWIAMTFAMAAFWSLVVVAIFAMRRDWTTRTSAAQLAEDAPLRVLDERLARGEIDVDEYQTRREILSGGR